MSLFASLYPLAQKTTLTLLITAEGDQLRVNVTPRANDDAKGEKPLYPLSILATPAELDRDFAEAVSIYEPSTLSVLDQARAASNANTDDAAPKALPAPAAKGKPGRRKAADQPQKSPAGNAGEPEPAGNGEAEVIPPDPRQMQIPALDEAGDASPAPTTATDQPQPAIESQPVAEDDGVDLL